MAPHIDNVHAKHPITHTEKYATWRQFIAARTACAGLRFVLRPLVVWRPLRDPEPGFTVLIGATAALPHLLEANLRMLDKQQAPDLREIIITTDCVRNDQASAREQHLKTCFPSLPLSFLYYTRLQARVLSTIKWAWCYAWLSWTLGIAHARTRYALLHDLDAMLLRSDILQERYHAIHRTSEESHAAKFIGVRYYNDNGLTPDDRLAVTFELIFDIQYVREHFRPIDVFNQVRRWRGRRSAFDTLLDVQARAGMSDILPVDETHMVHPSQLICQFAELKTRRRYAAPGRTNLPLLPYLLHLGGDEQVLSHHQQAFEQTREPAVPFLGHLMDASNLVPSHLEWLRKQAGRLDQAVVGEVRPEVSAYFDAIENYVQRQLRRDI